MESLRLAAGYARILLKWLALALLTGGICGLTGALFYNGIAWVTALREAHPALLFGLPAAGPLIVLLYRTLRAEGNNTDTVIEAARDGSALRFGLLPSIFAGTILTHLCGGSSGREGAALQIGGDIGSHLGALFHFDREDMKITTMVGMSAFFSAIFGTPLTATVFVTLFLTVGTFYEAALLPGIVASLAAIGVSGRFGVAPFRFSVEMPAPDMVLFLKIMVLAAAAGLMSVVFVEVLHRVGHLYERFFPTPYLRAVVGGCLVVALTLLIGEGFTYNGAGGPVIAAAVQEGQAPPASWLLKILFTALTLEAGFKGGEIVPTFFIGATFGCRLAPLLGLDPRVGAAIGLVAIFAGATNSVLPAIFLSVEAFGGGGLLYFSLACIVSYMVSGYNGLYSSQKILYSKVRATYIDATANHSRLYAGHIHSDQQPPVEDDRTDLTE